MPNSDTQANVAPAAAPAKAKQEQNSDAQAPSAQPAQKQQQRAPKLAPAPVPQQTPWKAPTVDQPASDPIQPVKKGSPTVVAAAAAAASSSQRSKEREQASGSAKRATTGKEKWVPFAPVPIPSQQQQQQGSRNNRQNKRPSQNSARGRRVQGNNEKRRENRSSGHQRTQSRSVRDDASSSGSSTGSANSSSNSNNTETQTNSNDIPDVDKLSLEDKSDRRYPSRYNQRPNQNRNQKASRINKVPYYPGGFIPGPGGVGYTMPVVPMAQVIPAMASPEFLFPTLVPQVDYYFSVENLCKDMFLRKNMNDEGLVPISVIADFNRVKMLTQSVEMVAQACQLAPNIEVVGSKVRAVQNWENWILAESERTPFGKDNKSEPSDEELKFQVDQAVPFVPKSEK